MGKIETVFVAAVVAVGQMTEIEWRRAVRRHLGLRPRDNTPVIAIDGAGPPQLEGQRWGYETAGGTPIRHPSAYMRKGWSNAFYRPSTRRIEVGWQWQP